jgi:hypothetical protein
MCLPPTVQRSFLSMLSTAIVLGLYTMRPSAGFILDSRELSKRQASQSMCTVLTFYVDRDLRVFCGGACDSGGIVAAAPELSGEFYQGTLNEEGFEPLLEA